MRLTSAMLADAAQVVGGKLFVMGGAFDVISARSFPALHRGLSIVLVAEIGPGDRNRDLELSMKLLDEDGNDENIDTGYWGNITLTPGGTNVNFDVNYVRLENTGTYNTQQATVNFVGTTWDSAVGDSIDIDGNVEYRGCWTNYSTDNPGNSFVSEGSTWTAWQSDVSGSYEYEFYATGEFIWVQIRILAVPSPLGGATDCMTTYTTTATGVG